MLAVAGLASSSLALAALPAPTPAQLQVAAAKKAAADAEAARSKESLAKSMDAISARWRGRAASQGWTTHAPVAIAAAPAPGTPPGATGAPTGAPSAGSPAPNAANAAPVVPASGAVPQAVQTTGVAITGKPMPGVAPGVTGVSANTITGTPAGRSAASPGGGAAPRSPQALQSANVPIKSEKHGTAAPSPDVKKTPTKSVPAGASPGNDKSIAESKKE
ncbi:MAG: hypothetical protein V7631_4361 [Massilia sp.]|jgi:hypothetical protein